MSEDTAWVHGDVVKELETKIEQLEADLFEAQREATEYRDRLDETTGRLYALAQEGIVAS